VFTLSPIKLVVIVAVVLVLLGPDKLPEVAHRLGTAWRALKRVQERVEDEVRQAIPDLPSSGEIARLARSPVNLLNTLAQRVDAAETTTELPEPPPNEVPDSHVALESQPMVARNTGYESTPSAEPFDPSLN
jgi:TatA/E family protein of Tat protein translocase